MEVTDHLNLFGWIERSVERDCHIGPRGVCLQLHKTNPVIRRWTVAQTDDVRVLWVELAGTETTAGAGHDC